MWLTLQKTIFLYLYDCVNLVIHNLLSKQGIH